LWWETPQSEADRASDSVLILARAGEAALRHADQAMSINAAREAVAPLNATIAALNTETTAMITDNAAATVRLAGFSTADVLSQHLTALDEGRHDFISTVLDVSVAASIAVSDVHEHFRAWVATERLPGSRGFVWLDLSAQGPHAALAWSGSVGCNTTTGSPQRALCDSLRGDQRVAAADSHQLMVTGAAGRHRVTCVVHSPHAASTAAACLTEADEPLRLVRVPAMTSFTGVTCASAVRVEDGAWLATEGEVLGQDGYQRPPASPAMIAMATSAQAEVLDMSHHSLAQVAVRLDTLSRRFRVQLGPQLSTHTFEVFVHCALNATTNNMAAERGVRSLASHVHRLELTTPESTNDLMKLVDSPQYAMSRVATVAADSAFTLSPMGEPVVAGWTELAAVRLGAVLTLNRNTVHDVLVGFATALQSTLRLDGNRRSVGFAQGHANGTGLVWVVDPGMELPTDGAVADATRHAKNRRRDAKADDGDITAAAAPVCDGRAVVYVSHDHSTVAGGMWARLAIAAGVALGLCVFVQGWLVFISGSVVGTAAHGSGEVRGQMDAEKVQFGNLVRDALPPSVLPRFRAGEALICDYYPQLTFFFSDIVSFTERTKYMSNQELVRFLGYTFMLLDNVAEYYDIHKIKSIGDAFFAVAGLEDLPFGNAAQKAAEKRKPRSKSVAGKALMASASATPTGGRSPGAGGAAAAIPQHHQTYRMTAFAAISQMLLTPMFHHVPERTECFADAAGGTAQPTFKPAPCRMGIHVGPANAGIFDAGRAPQFDCVGGTVGQTGLMEGAAIPGTIRISEQARKALLAVDPNRDFVCSEPQRTLTKTQGRIETYTIVACFLNVPQPILDAMHIDRSVKRRAFGDTGFILEEVDKTTRFKTGFGHDEMTESTMLSSMASSSEADDG
jgi:class 3 adenylate cyclase